MSKINFITGELEGRLGEIVGSRHRGTYYTKRFTPPANPDTTSQHGARNVFSHVTKLGSLLYPDILQDFLFPKSLKGTDINTIVKNNDTLIKSHNWNPAAFKIGNGGLPGGGTVNFTRSNTAFSVTWQHDPAVKGDDVASFIIYDETTFQIAIKVRTRDDESANITLNINDFSKVYGYLFFSRVIIPYKNGVCSTTYGFKFP